MFRHNDGNGGWDSLTKGLQNTVSVQAITDHPTEANAGCVGTQDGPDRGRDGGATWERGNFPRDLQCWSITVHPKNPKTLYAGTAPVGVFRSEDGGDTWTKLPNAKQHDRITMA